MPANTAKLLHFMAPGFLHGMSNALFTIQAQAQVRNAGPEIAAGCATANAVLEVMRLVADPRGGDDPGPVGPALRTVVELLRIGLRDQGVRVDVEDAVLETTDRAPLRTFVRAMVLATEQLHGALPTGCDGHVRLSWLEPGVFCIEFVAAASQLPFEIDLAPAQRRLTEALRGTGFEARQRQACPGLVLRLPDAEGSRD
jgi:hypothetical protein